MGFISTRRAFAVLLVAACIAISLPSSAAVNLIGTIAKQDRVPARLANCSVAVDGAVFSPNVSFAQQPNPVARYTVLLAFFDRRNIAVGHVDVTDHGNDSYDLPAGADSMTCAIARLTLDDGSTYPASSAGNPSAGGVVLGVLGAGALVGIALGVAHHNSSSSGATTPTPSPSSSGATATPSASPSSSSSSGATATPTAAGSPTPSPFPTVSPTAIPSLRPQIFRQRDPKTGVR